MGKPINKNNLEYLGEDFQYKLAKVFIEDSKLFSDLASIIDQNSFTNPLLRIFVGALKDYYIKESVVPSYETIGVMLRGKANTDIELEEYVELIKKLKETSLEGYNVVKDKAIRFFKQQNLIKVANKIIEIAGKGDIERYPECQKLLEDAAMAGQEDEFGHSLFDLEDQALSNDYTVSIPTGIAKMDEVLGGGLDKGKLGLIIAPAGFGKALSENEKVYTPQGYRLMKEIKIGDYVIGSNGKKTLVTGVFPQGKRDIYTVKFSDGTSCRCDMEHLWNVNSFKQRNNRNDKTYKTMTLKDIIEEGLFVRDGRHNFKIPVCNAVEFDKKEVLIDPYLLGYFIGDGCFERGTITCGDTDLNEIVINLQNKGYTFKIHEHKNRATSIDFPVKIREELKAYYNGHYTSGNKYIPKEYIYNDIETRVAILNGLMDSDGTAQKNGTSCFNTKSKQLANDVREIVLSLGGFCKIREKKASYYSKKYEKRVDCGMQYELTITLCNENIPLFRLKRKQDRVKYRTKYKDSKYIDSVEFGCNENAICIKVDAEDELFLTNDYIVTHNTSFTTAICSYAASYQNPINNNEGYKVLQIYFEDDDVDVARKHFSRITQQEARSFKRLNPDDREEIRRKIDNSENKELLAKNLRLVHFKTGTKSASDIDIFIKRLINTGFKPDLISIDYFECLAPEKGGYSTDSEWTREGVTMRKLETMAHELNAAIWVPTQGTKDSINSPDVVTMSQAGGSAKKIHVAQLIISIARSIEDQENNKATVAILKNRSGQSGKVFHNIKFNNGTSTISCDEMIEYDSESSFQEVVDNVNERNRIDLQRKYAQVVQTIHSELKESDSKKENASFQNEIGTVKGWSNGGFDNNSLPKEFE